MIEILLLNFTNHTYFDIKLENIGVKCKIYNHDNKITSLIDLDSIDVATHSFINIEIEEYNKLLDEYRHDNKIIDLDKYPYIIHETLYKEQLKDLYGTLLNKNINFVIK